METVIQPYGFKTQLDLPDVRFREAREKPFDLYGLYNPHTEAQYRRLPHEAAEKVSPNVTRLSRHTAGGRVRFCTDSGYIAVHAIMPLMGHMEHFPYTGSTSFDVYVKEGSRYYFYAAYRPGIDPSVKMMEGVVRFPDRKLRQIMLHFPLYSEVEKLYIGLQENAVLDHGLRYRYDKPVVYYGSSITQGGCASRPGTSYQSIISIKCDCDFINLGFSGSALGEQAMAEYIASLDMSVFVMDYDHNSPSAEHLQPTHEALYRAVRAAHPDLPIVMVTAPDTMQYVHGSTQSRDIRRAAIYENYQKALAEGDKNVRYIDGDGLFEGKHHDVGTVDGCHPNDVGFIRMADRIGHTVASLLK